MADRASRWAGTLRSTLWVAAAYLLAAAVGKLLATPPHNDMLLWPAAAVGLVAAVRLGGRGLPGVALGGAVYALWRLAQSGPLGPVQLLGAVEVGLVVMGRAWLGVLLYRALARPGPRFTLARRLGLLVLAGGPLACLPAALLGGLGLMASGHVGPEGFWRLVGHWYLSDVLGVVLAAPIIVGFTSRTSSVRIAVAVGSVLGVGGWMALSTMELRAMQADLAREAAQVGHVLERLGANPTDWQGAAGELAHVDPEGLELLVVPTGGGPAVVARPAVGASPDEVTVRVGRAALVATAHIPGATVTVAATPSYETRHRTLLPLAALAVIWALAVFVGYHVRLLGRRGADLEALVELRTRDLEAARARAEAANEAKSLFLAHMSHELRTPMNGVIGLVSLMMQDDLPEGQRARAEMLDASARSLLRIIDDVLDVAKIEQGRVEVERAPVALAPLVRQVLQTVSGAASLVGTWVSTSVDPAVPEQVLGDEKRLLQVLLNLVGNAVKFSPGGRVELRVRMVSGAPQPRLRIEVADDGVGIPADRQAAVFDAFVQSDASTTRRFGGTGLGLAITRQLVQLMGGEIGLVSVEGEGSTFWLELPATPAAAPPRPAAPPALVLSAGLRVLLVEDNRVNQYVAKSLLEREGCQVVLAEDGARALERWRAEPFDLVVMDCQMPVMDGFEAARRIRAEESPAARVPIVALTAGALESERARCFDAGMDDFLSKPLERQELRAALARWSPRAAGVEVLTAAAPGAPRPSP